MLKLLGLAVVAAFAGLLMSPNACPDCKYGRLVCFFACREVADYLDEEGRR